MGEVALVLSILYFIISVAVFGIVSYYVIEFVTMMAIEYRICNFSLGVAQDYLMENGRGFFRDKTSEAILMEAQIRSFLIMAYYLLLLVLVLMFLPSEWAFWIVPRWAIKIGVALGVFVNGLFSTIISVTTRTMVGRLDKIDEKGVANFSGVWGSDFTFDVGKYWEPDDYPPEGWKFMVLKFVLFGGLAPLELTDDEI